MAEALLQLLAWESQIGKKKKIIFKDVIVDHHLENHYEPMALPESRGVAPSCLPPKCALAMRLLRF
jgi:hypothetical protein